MDNFKDKLTQLMPYGCRVAVRNPAVTVAFAILFTIVQSLTGSGLFLALCVLAVFMTGYNMRDDVCAECGHSLEEPGDSWSQSFPENGQRDRFELKA